MIDKKLIDKARKFIDNIEKYHCDNERYNEGLKVKVIISYTEDGRWFTNTIEGNVEPANDNLHRLKTTGEIK